MTHKVLISSRTSDRPPNASSFQHCLDPTPTPSLNVHLLETNAQNFNLVRGSVINVQIVAVASPSLPVLLENCPQTSRAYKMYTPLQVTVWLSYSKNCHWQMRNPVGEAIVTSHIFRMPSIIVLPAEVGGKVWNGPSLAFWTNILWKKAKTFNFCPILPRFFVLDSVTRNIHDKGFSPVPYLHTGSCLSSASMLQGFENVPLVQ